MSVCHTCHAWFQTLCFGLACVSGAAFTANILQLEHVNASLHQLQMAHNKNPQVTKSNITARTFRK